MRFHEIQQAPKGLRTLLWVVLAVTAVLGVVIGIAQLSTDPTTTTGDIVFMVLMVVVLPTGLVLWLNLIRQVVVIDEQGVSVQQKGLMLKPKVIPWTEVKAATVRPINAFGEFGGWGVRYGYGSKWGYILDGTHALELTLHSGKPRVITVVDEEGARAAIQQREERGS